MIRFLPWEGSSGFFSPRLGLWPKVLSAARMEGMRIWASLSALKKNWTKVPVTVGGCTSGDSGNYYNSQCKHSEMYTIHQTVLEAHLCNPFLGKSNQLWPLLPLDSQGRYWEH